MKFRHILFPVDFSERCAGAASHVEALAKHFNAEVTLLHVIWHGEFETFALVNDPLTFVPEEQLRSRLEAFAVERLPSVNAICVLEEGEPAQMITKFAEENGVDLIMMPSHGYGPFRSLLLGSVTAKVLHDARCPVWTEAHIEGAGEPRHIPCRSVLCAVDLTPRTASLMKCSSALAGEFGATLRFVHAVPGSETWAMRRFGDDLEKELQQQSRKQVAGFEKEAGVEAPVCVGAGSIASVVREEAKRHGADLVVIGRGCIRGNLGRLRTNAYGIIRESPCPVISI